MTDHDPTEPEDSECTCGNSWDAPDLVPANWGELYPGTVPTRVVTIVEYIDGDNGTGVTAIISDHCPPWSTLGLVGWLDSKVRGELAARTSGDP